MHTVPVVISNVFFHAVAITNLESFKTILAALNKLWKTQGLWKRNTGEHEAIFSSHIPFCLFN